MYSGIRGAAGIPTHLSHRRIPLPNFRRLEDLTHRRHGADGCRLADDFREGHFQLRAIRLGKDQFPILLFHEGAGDGSPVPFRRGHVAIAGGNVRLRIDQGPEQVVAALATNFLQGWPDVRPFIPDAMAGGAIGRKILIEDPFSGGRVATVQGVAPLLQRSLAGKRGLNFVHAVELQGGSALDHLQPDGRIKLARG